MFPILLLLAGASPADSWPAFRGDGTARSTATRAPVQWSPTENLAWRADLPGYGQSSPVVHKNRVFVTAVDGSEKEKLFVVAFDAPSGKLLWKKEAEASQKGKNNPMMSRAGPTPVVDDAGVYAFFESGDVLAFSLDGKALWQRSLGTDYGEIKNNHGLASSLAQTRDAVILLVDHTGPSYLLALDKKSGKPLWKADRPARISWTSPVVGTIADKEFVIVSGGGTVIAYDASNGKELARQEGLFGNTIPSPTLAGPLVVVGAGDNPRKPDPEAAGRSNCCLRLTFKDGAFSFERAWDGQKAISHHASPLVFDGYAYFLTKVGILHCVELSTGEVKYTQRLDNPCWATPIAVAGRLYFFGKDGITTVVKPGPRFEKLAANRLWTPEEFARRFEEAKKKAEASIPKRPKDGKDAKGPKGPPLPKGDLEATRYSAVGDVVYGSAAVQGAFFIRTGTEIICIRDKGEKP